MTMMMIIIITPVVKSKRKICKKREREKRERENKKMICAYVIGVFAFFILIFKSKI